MFSELFSGSPNTLNKVREAKLRPIKNRLKKFAVCLLPVSRASETMLRSTPEEVIRQQQQRSPQQQHADAVRSPGWAVYGRRSRDDPRGNPKGNKSNRWEGMLANAATIPPTEAVQTERSSTRRVQTRGRY